MGGVRIQEERSERRGRREASEAKWNRRGVGVGVGNRVVWVGRVGYIFGDLCVGL